MIFNQTEKEEKAYLMDIIALLAANIEQMDKAIEDKSKDVMEHKLYLWENLSELDRAEKSAVPTTRQRSSGFMSVFFFFMRRLMSS